MLRGALRTRLGFGTRAVCVTPMPSASGSSGHQWLLGPPMSRSSDDYSLEQLDISVCSRALTRERTSSLSTREKKRK